MLKILVADRSEAFSKRLAEELSCIAEVQLCRTGKEVLEEYSTFQPDMIVLELELPELDGLGLLRTLRATGSQVPVLAMSGTVQSRFVQQSLVRLGVEFVLPKPCTVAAVVSRLQEMACILRNREWTADDQATNLLLHMGFSTKSVGFCFVHDAVCMLTVDRMRFLTKEIYVELGKRYGSSKEAVERAIRCAIERAWKTRDERVWRCFFAPGSRGVVEKPSNAVFLRRLALSLENKNVV